MAHLNAAPADTNTPAEQARDHMLRLLIAEQNDAFRQVLGFAALWRGQHLKGRTVATPGFRAIPERTQAALMNAVITFTDWTEDNDLVCPLKSSLIALVKVSVSRLRFAGFRVLSAVDCHGRCMLASDGGSAEVVLAVTFPASRGSAAFRGPA